MLHFRTAGRRIPIVAHRNVACQTLQNLVIKNLRDEPHALVQGESITIRDRDARRFLSAMLERKETEEGEPRNIETMPKDPEDRAFLSQIIHIA